MSNKAISSMSTGPVFEVAAYAGTSMLNITTRDMVYVRGQLRRHMPAQRHEVPATWYARLDGYLDDALESGRAEFERFSGAIYIITARVVGN